MATTNSEDLDAELQALLVDLDESSKVVEQPAIPVLTIPPPEPELSEPPVIVAEATIVPAQDPGTPTNPIDLTVVVERFDKDYNTVQNNLCADRGKVDAVVAILLARVQAGTATNTEIESLVKALDVLTNTNGHHVKLLDSRSKLLAAAKSTAAAFYQQNNFGNPSAELTKLLDQPEDSV